MMNPLAIPAKAEADYTAWLVEMNEASGPVYFILANDSDWTKDHDKALHCSRREDAQQIIDYYGWTRVSAVEHCWPALTKVEARILPTRDELTQLVCDALWGPRDIGFRNNEVKEAGSRVADAVLNRLSAKAEAEVGMRKALEAIIQMDDDAMAAHGKPYANLNGYGLVDLFDCVGHPFGSGEHKQQPCRSNNLEAALSAARAALANLPEKTQSGCICQDQHRRGYCTEPGCPYAKTERAAVVEDK